jgi:hypothetical protein
MTIYAIIKQEYVPDNERCETWWVDDGGVIYYVDCDTEEISEKLRLKNLELVRLKIEACVKEIERLRDLVKETLTKKKTYDSMSESQKAVFPSFHSIDLDRTINRLERTIESNAVIIDALRDNVDKAQELAEYRYVFEEIELSDLNEF